MDSLLGKAGLNSFVGVRSGVFAYALPLHKNERLQQKITWPGFGLNVVGHVTVLDVSIEAEDGHPGMESRRLKGVNPAKKIVLTAVN
ncbi:MAG TPA: hypothetical protein VHN74_18800 [Candidatus Angelobacter sp.]|jgi:hypothetical protein|nr:hypothetical protein [Candidatus Angelobacter sp.]